MQEYQHYADPDDIDQRLSDLGLTVADLTDAARQGLYESLAATEHHPRTHSGFVGWSGTVKAIRDSLVPAGWTCADPDNLPLVIHPDGGVVLLVATGDSATGRPDDVPQTKNSKGATIEKLIARNAIQLQMFETEQHYAATAPQQVAWIFLLYRDDRRQELRIELSLPKSVSDDNRVNGWTERILLPSIPYDDEVLGDGEIDGPSGPDTSVEVKKRG